MPENSPENTTQAPKSSLDSAISGIFKLKDVVIDIIAKLSDLEQTNLQLGLKHMRAQQFFDAALRFKIVGWLKPENTIAQYLLGKALVLGGKIEKAKQPLQLALKARPDLEEAQFFLAICGVGDVPSRLPPSLEIELLENQATNFVEKFSAQNKKIYEAGFELLHKHLKSQNEQKTYKQGFDILELDIRNGASGEVCALLANSLVGVEPCLQLIADARPRRFEDRLVYNELSNKKPIDFLKKEERKFDIITAYHASEFCGDLNELFSEIVAHSRPSSFLLLAAKNFSGAGFCFDATNFNYQHSPEYIEKIADKQNFKIVGTKKIEHIAYPPKTLTNLVKKQEPQKTSHTVYLFSRAE